MFIIASSFDTRPTNSCAPRPSPRSAPLPLALPLHFCYISAQELVQARRCKRGRIDSNGTPWNGHLVPSIIPNTLAVGPPLAHKITRRSHPSDFEAQLHASRSPEKPVLNPTVIPVHALISFVSSSNDLNAGCRTTYPFLGQRFFRFSPTSVSVM